MLAATSAEAGEAVFSVENRLGGDSNVFRTSAGKNAKAKGFYEIAPEGRIQDDYGTFEYRVDYRPVYQVFFDSSRIDGLDHRQSGNASWKITPSDTVGVFENFSLTRRLRIDAENASDGSIFFEESDRERIRRVNGGLFYSRVIRPTTSAQIRLDVSDSDFTSLANVDSRSYGATLSVNHMASSKTTLGLIAAGRFRQSRGQALQSDTDTWIANGAVSIAHKLTPSLEISVQAGPTYIRSKEELSDLLLALPGTPPGLEGDRSSTISFFATVGIEKFWENGSRAKLGYSRSESANAGSGSSLVDTVSAQMTWKIDRNWEFSLYPTWSRNKVVSGTNSRQGSRRDFTTVSLTGAAIYRISEQLLLKGRLRFASIDQDRPPLASSPTIDPPDVTDTVFGFVGVQYIFEPWDY